jgi:hypothetical protein
LPAGHAGKPKNGSLANAEAALIASITIIRATTVNNTTMRLIMRYPLS